MIRIEVSSEETRVVAGTSQRTQKPYSFVKQDAWAYLVGEPHPTRIELSWDSAEEALQKGMYRLLPESIYVDRFGKLGIGRIKVQKAVEAAQAKAS